MGRRPIKTDNPKASAKTPGPNDIAAKAKPYIERMEYCDAEMKEKREEIAEAKKIILEEAETAGIQPKALKRILRLRKLQKAIAELPEKLEDIDARAQFEALADAFGDTPFGEHARGLANLERSAKKLADMIETDLDEAALREDEARLKHIGRGGKSDGKPSDELDNLADH